MARPPSRLAKKSTSSSLQPTWNAALSTSCRWIDTAAAGMAARVVPSVAYRGYPRSGLLDPGTAPAFGRHVFALENRAATCCITRFAQVQGTPAALAAGNIGFELYLVGPG